MNNKDVSSNIEQLRNIERTFKILWSYYNCMQSLMRSILKTHKIDGVNLNAIYEQLKGIEAKLPNISDDEFKEKLNEINNQLQRTKYILHNFDQKIPPSLTRRFIEKLEKYDIRFLIYFCQFYLKKTYLEQDDWDKIDLIFTKLFIVPDEKGQSYELRDHSQIKHILSIMTKGLNLPSYSEEKIHSTIAELAAITKEIRRVSAFSDFLEWGLLARIRDFKKSLKHLMLHPDVLIAMLTLNKTSKNKFINLNREEINKIGAGIEEIDKIGESLESIKEISISYAAPEVFSEEEEEKKEVDLEYLLDIRSRLDKILSLISQLPFSQSEDHNFNYEENVSKSIEIPTFLKPQLEELKSILTNIDWSSPLSQIAKSEKLKKYNFEAWELEAFQELFIQKNPEPLKSKINTYIFISKLLRNSISNLSEKIMDSGLAISKEDKKEKSSISKLVETNLEACTLYEKEMKGLINLCLSKEFYTFAKYLERANKKLQRSRLGLWLLYDSYMENLKPFSEDEKYQADKDLMRPIKVQFEISADKKKKK